MQQCAQNSPGCNEGVKEDNNGQ